MDFCEWCFCPRKPLATQGIQRIEGPILLRPTWLPLTLAMLGQMLRRLERVALKQHDCLMLRATLTLVFFGFLGSNGGLYEMLQLFSHSAPLFHYRDGTLLTAKLHLIEQCGLDTANSMTHEIAHCRAGLPSDTIQELIRWRSSTYQTCTRHFLTHLPDTRTMAAAQ
ncbi:hypothetical protein EMCRGX_G003212 [Ephydatia muelleri]